MGPPDMSIEKGEEIVLVAIVEARDSLFILRPLEVRRLSSPE